MFLRQTLVCLRKARVTIPQLSPTHTKARILHFCPHNVVLEPSSEEEEEEEEQQQQKHPYLECYDPLFVLECSPDLVTEGYRKRDDHCPHMIVESQEEGTFQVHPEIKLNTWYDVGHVLGEIDDGDDDGDDDDEWVWQAYNHEEEGKDEGRSRR